MTAGEIDLDALEALVRGGGSLTVFDMADLVQVIEDARRLRAAREAWRELWIGHWRTAAEERRMAALRASLEGPARPARCDLANEQTRDRPCSMDAGHEPPCVAGSP